METIEVGLLIAIAASSFNDSGKIDTANKLKSIENFANVISDFFSDKEGLSFIKHVE